MILFLSKKRRNWGIASLLNEDKLFAFILNIKLVPTLVTLFFNSLEKNDKCQKKRNLGMILFKDFSLLCYTYERSNLNYVHLSYL